MIASSFVRADDPNTGLIVIEPMRPLRTRRVGSHVQLAGLATLIRFGIPAVLICQVAERMSDFVECDLGRLGVSTREYRECSAGTTKPCVVDDR